jgi:hypothetical protein
LPEYDREGDEICDRDEVIDLPISFEKPAKKILQQVVQLIMIDAARHGLIESSPDTPADLQHVFEAGDGDGD